MRRGTRVGQAYVAVSVDGDNINEEIVDGVDGAGPGVEKAGRDHGERYGGSFSEGFFDRVEKNLGKGLDDALAEEGSSGGKSYGEQFEKAMKRMSKRMGKSIGKSLGEELADSLEMSMARMIDTLEERVSGNSGVGGGGGNGPGAGNQSAGSKQTLYKSYDFATMFEAARKKMHLEANKAIEADDRALVKRQEALYEKVRKDAERATKEAAKASEKAVKEAIKSDNEMWRIRNITAKAHYKYLSDLEKGRTDERGNAVTRLGSGKNGNLGQRVGALFGEGSRNNALNLFGKGIGNIVGLTDKVTKGAGKMFSTFSKGWTEAGEGASLFEKTLGGFSELGAEGGKGLSALIASAPGAGAAIVGIVAVLSVMVSVIGALIGLVTALAATIAGALTGAVLVAGGAFAALAAAGGLVVAAFTSMTDAQRKLLTDAFKPLKEEITGLGQIMLQDMVPAFSTWSKNLQNALMLAVPVAQVMGKAFADAGSIITAALSGPGFQMFATQLGVYLPSIVTKLSFALGQFLNGMAGLFAALLPYVNMFAGYLARVATEFANWSTSAAGQNGIAVFVDRSLTSLRSLWNFVTAFSGFLFKVLFSPEAAHAGNTIFDSMAKTFRKFTDNISRAQANGSFKKWFDDAIKFGGQLWKVISALGGTFLALYNSGVLTAVGNALGDIADIIRNLNKVFGPLINGIGKVLPYALKIALGPLQMLSWGLGKLGDGIDWVLDKLGKASKATGDWLNGLQATVASAANTLQNFSAMPQMPSLNIPSMSSVQSSGLDALNHTSVKHGGYKAPKTWKNPYKKWANSLIKDGPSTQAQVKAAVNSLSAAAQAGIKAAAAETGGEAAARDSLTTLVTNLITGGKDTVKIARDALNSAASSLASATSRNEAIKALRQVRSAQAALRAALQDQKGINQVAKGLATQKNIDWSVVDKMVHGLAYRNATLADYAAARVRVAALLDTANQKLADAISVRDQYKSTVTDAVKSFADLSTAQAQTINGVEQALTSNDITTTLQTKLDQIKHFQNDLQLLLAQGLSNDAYKQIVDQGVAGGTPIADALLSGGSAAIQQTNALVDQINTIAGQLGTDTSNRLYQAGVDAAQGLVDGLTSLSAQLDSAAAKLGNSIAAAVKKALGIKSPSTVMRDMMDYVGDGAVQGLGNQHVKVGNAAAALASVIGVNPTDNRGTTTTDDAVSGNSPKLLWTGDFITPTTDPKAVVDEALNEITGRL